MDITLVRILLKQLCKQPTGDENGMSANAVFDWGFAPGYDEQRESVRTHNELLVSKGIAQVERLRMKHHDDYAVLTPTEDGRIWCRYAYDDQQWEQHSDELRLLLTA